MAFSTAPLSLASVMGLLFCIGILGQYLAKAYLETKRRPIYIVAETSESNDVIQATAPTVSWLKH